MKTPEEAWMENQYQPSPQIQKLLEYWDIAGYINMWCGSPIIIPRLGWGSEAATNANSEFRILRAYLRQHGWNLTFSRYREPGLRWHSEYVLDKLKEPSVQYSFLYRLGRAWRVLWGKEN